MWSGSRKLDGAGRLSVKSGRVSTTGTVVGRKGSPVGGRSEQARGSNMETRTGKGGGGSEGKGMEHTAAARLQFDDPRWRIRTYVRLKITKVL